MNDELSAIKKAKEKLIQEGYSENNIFQEVSIQNKYYADLVIYQDGKPFIVIEVKKKNSLPDQNFKFDPYVRQAQTYASALKAKYFVITDGDDFFWFTFGDTGRPELLHGPIFPLKENKNEEITKDEINSKLLEFKTFINRRFEKISSEDFSLFIFAQILSEFGNSDLKESIIKDYIKKNNPLINEVFYLLEHIMFHTIKNEILLEVIDKIFIKPDENLFIPRWLSDFLAKLYKPKVNELILNLNSSYGNIVYSLTVNNPQNTIIGNILNLNQENWLKLQSFLANKDKETLLLKTDEIEEFSKDKSKFDLVISAPPFGLKNFNNKGLPTNILDFYIDLANKVLQNNGKIIFIVPDNFIFSQNNKKLKNVIFEHFSLKAIISLPFDTFYPYSTLKTSILILEKGNNVNNQTFFYSELGEIPQNELFNCTENHEIFNILKDYSKFISGKTDFKVSNLFNLNNLDTISSFSLETHLKNKSNKQYPLVPLKNLCIKIRGGIRIKLESDGKIPIIGPASIRLLSLNPDKFDFTTEENIPKGYLYTEVGDVLVNSIGTHVGEATIITNEFKNLLISKHIILLKPNLNLIIPEYLAVSLNSNFVSFQIKEIAKSFVISSISQSSFKEILIPLPPIEKQKQILQEILHIKNEIDSLKDILKNKEQHFIDLINRVD